MYIYVCWTAISTEQWESGFPCLWLSFLSLCKLVHTSKRQGWVLIHHALYYLDSNILPSKKCKFLAINDCTDFVVVTFHQVSVSGNWQDPCLFKDTRPIHAGFFTTPIFGQMFPSSSFGCIQQDLWTYIWEQNLDHHVLRCLLTLLHSEVNQGEIPLKNNEPKIQTIKLATGRPWIQLQSCGSLFLSLPHVGKKEKRAAGSLSRRMWPAWTQAEEESSKSDTRCAPSLLPKHPGWDMQGYI